MGMQQGAQRRATNDDQQLGRFAENSKVETDERTLRESALRRATAAAMQLAKSKSLQLVETQDELRGLRNATRWLGSTLVESAQGGLTDDDLEGIGYILLRLSESPPVDTDD